VVGDYAGRASLASAAVLFDVFMSVHRLSRRFSRCLFWHSTIGDSKLMSKDSDAARAAGVGGRGSGLTGEAEIARRQNMRLGMTLFGVYLVLYVAFVVISAFFPDAMEWRPLGGLNLALLFGFGLIASAILLAFIYGVFSRVASTGAGR
jgi:uncharacterized membrane protein (DUF485 family)